MTTLPVEEAPLYVILREHEEYGPFCKETLMEAMETGNVVPEDWVRKADRTSCWMSVDRLLYGPPEPDLLTDKMRRWLKWGQAMLKEAATRMSRAANRVLERCDAATLVTRASAIAWVCTAVAIGMMLLPNRPLALAVPWILAGVAAGTTLIVRHEVRRGVFLCLAASILPVVAFRMVGVANHYFDPNRRETALPPIGEMYSSMPQKSSDLRKSHSRAKSGIPALGLPQPTEEKK